MSIIERDEAGIPKVEIVEDGETFEEKSLIKAKAIKEFCKKIAERKIKCLKKIKRK